MAADPHRSSLSMPSEKPLPPTSTEPESKQSMMQQQRQRQRRRPIESRWSTRHWLLSAILPLLPISIFDIPGVSAHGYLKTPRSRNIVAWQDKNWETYLSGNGGDNDPMPEDCPHCINRGGRLAQCGTIFGVNEGVEWERNYDQPLNGRGQPMSPNIQGVYHEGDIIEVEVMVTTHHRGHFEFSVCPIDDTVPMPIPTEECFANNKLTFISDETYGAPVDVNYPERAYIAPASKAEWTNGAPGEQPVFGAYYKMKFQLPMGVSGEVVLLQWYYLTANSCKHEGYADYPFPEAWGSDVDFYPGLPDCEEVPPDGNGVPEQFWNCAEIEIAGSSGTGSFEQNTPVDTANKPEPAPDATTTTTAASPRTKRPTQNPITSRPTGYPTPQPSRNKVTDNPSKQPTPKPVTASPSKQPTQKPVTASPSKRPTSKPATASPSKRPTSKPSKRPTRRPTRHPTSKPSKRPTRNPTKEPTRKPQKQQTPRPAPGNLVSGGSPIASSLLGSSTHSFTNIPPSEPYVVEYNSNPSKGKEQQLGENIDSQIQQQQMEMKAKKLKKKQQQMLRRKQQRQKRQQMIQKRQEKRQQKRQEKNKSKTK